MRTTHILPIWLLMCLISGIPLIAQNNCGPEEVIDTGAFEGTAFFNYGSTSRSKSNVYKTAFAVGQTFVGFTENVQNNSALGFYARYFLPPFALKVKATQGDLLDRIQVTWEIDALGPSPSEGFNIYRDGIFLAAVASNIRSYNDFNVIAGRPYMYTVRGINVFGEGVASDALGFQVPNGVVTGWVSSINGSPVPGATVTLTPMQGFSAKFEDGDGALAIADSLNPFLPALDEDWTIAFWIKTDTAGANSGKLIGMPGLVIRSRPSTNGNEGIAVATTPTGTAFLVANFPNNPNGWHHVALTYDKNGNKGRLYFDGELMGIASMEPVATPDEINFGERIASGLWIGRIDELRIYHRLLDELDFDMVMEGTASSTTPNLTHYWKMDEELGEKSYDIVNRHVLYFCGAEFNADRPQVHTAGITNEEGFYMIESASYGTGTTFLAKPSKNFYMHRALKFEKSEFDFATLPDFPLTPKATIEVWVNNAGPNGTQGILIKNLGNAIFKVELEENGLDNDINVHLNGVTHTYGLLGSGYKHLAFTWDSTTNTIKGYKNGVLLNTFSYPAVTGEWSGHGPWVLGYSGNLLNTFDGLIDEIAFYDTTLSIATIQNHFQNSRNPQEKGLRVYFPLDEGSGTRLNNMGSLLLQGGGTTFGTEWTPLAVHQVVEPHVFTPATRQVTLNPSVTSVDQVDFTDRSTIAVTGYVRYQNTDCFARKVEILVNGESFSPKIFTDSTGKFVIDFDPGTTAILTPKFEDHVFVPAFWEVTNVSSPIAGILFNDITTRTITGQVAGGLCKQSIITNPGQQQGTVCIVKVSSYDGCLARQITIDNEEGNFEFHDLPPLENMTIAVVEHSDPSIKTAFDVQGGSVIDISKQDTLIDFIYFAPPTVEVMSGLENFPGCDKIVFDQFEHVLIKIKLKEEYAGGDCEIDTASFHIINGFGETVLDTVMSNGVLDYSFVVGTPNPSPPHLKTLQIIATTLSGVEGSLTVQAIITGIRAKENTFTTVLPEIPGLILRDPPGDGSYSFLEKNEKFCQKTAFSNATEVGVGGGVKLLLGVETETVVAPLGIGTEFDWEHQNDIGIDAQVTYQQTSQNEYETCTSFDSRISTSAGDLIVGGERGGDLYMGTALNIIYGNVDIVTFDTANCVAMDSTAVQIQPGDFATTFIYSEFFILGTLMPSLETLASDPLADSADVAKYNESIERWQAIVDNNRAQKANALFMENISFDAGTEFEYAATSDTTSSETFEQMVKGEFKLETTFGFKIKKFGVEFNLRATTATSGGERNESMTSKGIKSGYHLSDNDPLDAFTFDVAMDSVYKTPVFNLKSGQSSCPWEPGTANREGTNLELASGSDFVAVNVPSNEPAVFQMLLGNLSATNEDWTYGFTSVAANNPHGAIIKLNGQPLNYVQQFIIPYGTSQLVTLTVDRGPIEYDYDSLLVAEISSCEWERNHALSIPVDSDSNFFSGIYLGVHFIRPCSEVNINVPQQDWVIFPDPLTDSIVDDNNLRITVSGYDLNEPYFQSVRLQYRPSDGDGAWINIPDTSERYNPNWVDFNTLPGTPPKLGPVFTQFYWQTFGLKDGPYEIRAVAVCTGDATDRPGYSQIIKGRIDREPPSLVGVPQPSDGVLHVGDEISFTFNQHVNCDMLIQADIMNENNVGLYDATTNELIDANITCFENKIVIDPLFQNEYYENHIMRTELHHIKDLTGNILIETDWEFYVDRNELAWLTDSAGITKYEDEVKSVNVKIHNRGGYPVPFSIVGIPDWVRVSPDAGTLVANEIREIQFTAEDTLDLGWFTDSIVLHTETGQNPFFMGGDEALPFAVRNICRPPDWIVNPTLYQLTMTMIARIRIDNIFSADPEDQVGVFIEGQLRGAAKLIYVPSSNNWIAFVTIYGNTGDIGKELTFEIFDASACLHYPAFFSLGGSLTFAANGTSGSPTAPRVLINNGTLLHEIPVQTGWNWISFNLGFPDPAINEVLDNISSPAGDLIKDQTRFATYNNNTWSGSLSIIPNTSLYMYQAAKPNTIKITGTPLSPDSVTIQVVTGWNWIGYIPTYKLPVNAALASLPATAGDIIKSQTAFAQYVNSAVGWIGDLKTLQSPQGYLLRMATGGTITYPPQSVTGDEPSHVRNVDALSTFWNVDPLQYEHNMTLIGMFWYDNTNATTTDMELGAFVGNEIRGVAAPVYIEYLDAYLFFITCYANTGGEQFHFKLYDAATGDVHILQEKLLFSPNGHNGSVFDPVPFSLQTTGTADVTDMQFLEVHPNPFTTETTCRFILPYAQDVHLSISDMRGMQVFEMEASGNAGLNAMVWNGQSPSGSYLSNGVYVLRLESKQGVVTRKVVLQR